MTFVLKRVDAAGAPDSIPLADLAVGAPARLCEPVDGSGALGRLEALGFVPGTRLVVVRRAPFGGPIEIELRGYRICLRRRQLDGMRVQLDGEGGLP